MKKMPLKLVAFTALLLAGCQQASAAPALNIGDKAPALEISEWVSLGKDRFKPVKTFQPGKVYVVEFWATWCGPCIAMMPHIASLQEKYADQGLQVVSITDDERPAIDALMKKEAPNAEGKDKTYSDITSHYTVGSDPDRSVHDDYMLATRQSGIPTAYIVGKDGRLEWVGHPGEMEEPLDAVVKGTWDRDAFKDVFQDQQRLLDLDADIQKIAERLKATEVNKEFVAALMPVIEKYEKEIKSDEIRLQVTSTKLKMLMKAQPDADSTAKLFEEILTNKDVSAVFKHDMAWSAYEQSMESDAVNKRILQVAAEAIPDILPKLSTESHATVMDTLAHLQNRLGDTKTALATAEKAYELSGKAPEYEAFIKELKEKLKGG